MHLIKRGAEADIYLTEWYRKRAISKVRKPKGYRYSTLDAEIRRKRTIHEAEMISNAKRAGVLTPLVYFVDPQNAEIVMEYVKGELVRDILSKRLMICKTMGSYTARLHKYNIVHGDLTTSNFILRDGKLVLIDFGLAHYSDRIEDKAVDIRLIKEIMSSAHASVFTKAFNYFLKGYESIAGRSITSKVLAKVSEIERRGRYARVV
jgi:TP53 regulating kinase-like protein